MEVGCADLIAGNRSQIDRNNPPLEFVKATRETGITQTSSMGNIVKREWTEKTSSIPLLPGWHQIPSGEQEPVNPAVKHLYILENRTRNGGSSFYSVTTP